MHSDGSSGVNDMLNNDGGGVRSEGGFLPLEFYTGANQPCPYVRRQPDKAERGRRGRDWERGRRGRDWERGRRGSNCGLQQRRVIGLIQA
jgi:hypothetical protein